jgi:addiction module HigA family antidote
MELRRIKRRRPTHPGVLLQSEIEARGLDQSKVAALVSVGRKTVNAICHGQRRVSVDTAHRFGRLFGNGPQLWLNMQKSVDLWDSFQANEHEYAKIETLSVS